MIEQYVMKMYEETFDQFTKQVKDFYYIADENNRDNIHIPSYIINSMYDNLNSWLEKLDISLDQFKNEDFKIFYKNKIGFYKKYLLDLSELSKNTLENKNQK